MSRGAARPAPRAPVPQRNFNLISRFYIIIRHLHRALACRDHYTHIQCIIVERCPPLDITAVNSRTSRHLFSVLQDLPIAT